MHLVIENYKSFKMKIKQFLSLTVFLSLSHLTSFSQNHGNDSIINLLEGEWVRTSYSNYTSVSDSGALTGEMIIDSTGNNILKYSKLNYTLDSISLNNHNYEITKLPIYCGCVYPNERLPIKLPADSLKILAESMKLPNNLKIEAGKTESIVGMPCGSIYVIGSFQQISLVNDSLLEINVFSGFHITRSFYKKIDRITKITLHQKKVDTAIYPNPANTFVKVQVDEQIDTISIFSITGELKKVLATKGSVREIDVSDLAEGLYVIRLSDNIGSLIATHRIFVTH